jgi:hypothetical protein
MKRVVLGIGGATALAVAVAFGPGMGTAASGQELGSAGIAVAAKPDGVGKPEKADKAGQQATRAGDKAEKRAEKAEDEAERAERKAERARADDAEEVDVEIGADRECPANLEAYQNHGQYVSCVARGEIGGEPAEDGANHGQVVSEAAQSDVGKPEQDDTGE